MAKTKSTYRYKSKEEKERVVIPDPARVTTLKKSFDYTPACWCYDAADIDECDSCGVTWDYERSRWRWTKTGITYKYKCRHYDQELKFPSGVSVFASSMTDRDEDDEAPDWGLYLDSGWQPQQMAGTICWHDFGLPENWETAAYMIIDAYRKAKAGYWVEVGCIGGHGRTGTALACFAVLGGIAPTKAVQWVRKNYCDCAVETAEQEWFVTWFAAFVFGGASEEYPAKKEEDRYVYTFEDALDWENMNLFDKIGRRPTAPVGVSYVRQTKWPKKKKKESKNWEDQIDWTTLDADQKDNFLNGTPPKEPTPEEQAKINDWVDEYLDKRKDS